MLARLFSYYSYWSHNAGNSTDNILPCDSGLSNKHDLLIDDKEVNGSMQNLSQTQIMSLSARSLITSDISTVECIRASRVVFFLFDISSTDRINFITRVANAYKESCLFVRVISSESSSKSRSGRKRIRKASVCSAANINSSPENTECKHKRHKSDVSDVSLSELLSSHSKTQIRSCRTDCDTIGSHSSTPEEQPDHATRATESAGDCTPRPPVISTSLELLSQACRSGKSPIVLDLCDFCPEQCENLQQNRKKLYDETSSSFSCDKYISMAYSYNYMVIPLFDSSPQSSNVSQRVCHDQPASKRARVSRTSIKSSSPASVSLPVSKHCIHSVLRPIFYSWRICSGDCVYLCRQLLPELLSLCVSRCSQFRSVFGSLESTMTVTYQDICDRYVMQRIGSLHCTSHYVGHTPAAESRAEGVSQLSQYLGLCHTLRLHALLITPRAIMWRVRLYDEQLSLWQDRPMPKSVCRPSSTRHIKQSGSSVTDCSVAKSDERRLSHNLSSHSTTAQQTIHSTPPRPTLCNPLVSTASNPESRSGRLVNPAPLGDTFVDETPQSLVSEHCTPDILQTTYACSGFKLPPRDTYAAGAHVTIGCRAGTRAVRAYTDLVECTAALTRLSPDTLQCVCVPRAGVLVTLPHDCWYLELTRDVLVDAVFSAHYACQTRAVQH